MMSKSKSNSTTKNNKSAARTNPELVPIGEAMSKPKKNVKAKASQVAKPAKAPKERKPKKASGLDAAYKVLVEAKEPMTCGDMVQVMLDKAMWFTKGATPSATIYAAIIREIAAKGKDSRFKKTDRGMFTATPTATSAGK